MVALLLQLVPFLLVCHCVVFDVGERLVVAVVFVIVV